MRTLEHLRIVDRTGEPLSGDALLPFASDELWCKAIGQGAAPLVHLWRHRQAFILGLRDRKLPQAAEAMEQLRGQQWEVAVRSSGGAAVPLDAGVLNVSLILPNPQGRMEHRADFELMFRLLCEAFDGVYPSLRFVRGEVAGSYCPGDYDVAVDGRKFCGMAQRRQLRAFIVQAFVLVEGEGAERGRLARRFYDAAAGEEDATDKRSAAEFPQVVPERMISLSEAGVLPGGGVMEAAARIGRVLRGWGAADECGAEPEFSDERLQAAVAVLRERYG